MTKKRLIHSMFNEYSKKSLLLIIFGFCASTGIGIAEAKNSAMLRLTNQLEKSRASAPVSVSRDKLGFEEDGTKVQSLSIKEGNTTWNIPFQLDDTNQDGRWDELFFVVNIGPSESLSAKVTSGAETPDFGRQVKAFIKKGRVKNAVWESELMGYRMYSFLHVDPLGKTVPRLTTKHFFGSNGHSHHNFTPGWGQDYLSIGNTMGVNSFFVQTSDGDISRPWTSNSYHTESGLPYDCQIEYKVIVDGPLRAVIEARINGWEIGGESHECRVRYTITAEQRHTKVRISFNPHDNNADGVRLGTGFMQMYEDIYEQKTDSYMLAVARNTRERGILHQWVGRAIVPFNQDGVEHLQMPDDPAKDFAPGNGPNAGLLFPPEQTTGEYAFVMAWEKDGGITSTEQWQNYVAELAERVNHPVSVAVTR